MDARNPILVSAKIYRIRINPRLMAPRISFYRNTLANLEKKAGKRERKRYYKKVKRSRKQKTEMYKPQKFTDKYRLEIEAGVIMIALFIALII